MNIAGIILLALAIVVSGAIANTAHAQSPPLSLPTDLAAARGAEPGTFQLTWSIVDEAPFYHIGWVAMPNVRSVVAADRPWHEAFRTVAIENNGQSGHKVTHLVPGVEYRFVIGTSQDRFTHPREWSAWTPALALSAGPSVCPDGQDTPADRDATLSQLTRNALEFDYAVGKHGGRLTYTTIGGPLTFNLAIATDSSSSGVLGHLFEGLTQTSWLTNRVEPSLAESWQHSGDGLTWTFYLRDDVRWHDGTPFSAHDVEFTFNRILYNDDIPASSRSVFTFRVPGDAGGESRTAQMTVTALDNHTVQFVLPTPFAPFLRSMGTPIYPRHILEPRVDDGTFADTWGIDADPTTVIGTGPFTIARYVPDQGIALQRNADYWLKDADGSPLPYLDLIVQVIVPDLAAELAAFRAGQADLHGVTGPEYAELYPLQQAENFTIHRRGPTFGSTFLAFNMNPGLNPDTGEPFLAPEKLNWFSNLQFRQAVAHSIDKEAIINDVLHGLGYPQWASVSPAAGDFHNPDVRRYEYDVDRANSMLDDLGWVDTDEDGVREDSNGNPITFNLTTNTGNTQRQKVGAIIHRGLQDIGIGAAYRFSEFGGLVRQLTSTYGWESMVIGFSGTSEPHISIDLWHSSGNFHLWHPNQTRPATDWEAAIDDLYTRGSQELDHGRRVELYHEAQAIAAENVPVIYTARPERIAAVRNVFGNTTATLYGLWDIRYLYRTD